MLDLRGLDILTLSACETALGRFDYSDNIQGLTSAFFQAGVSTIIGTLWEVELNSALCFFDKFYTEIKEGNNRLDSFAKAQKVTKERYPEYRDWGAFYFMGEWVETKESNRPSAFSIPGIFWLTMHGKLNDIFGKK